MGSRLPLFMRRMYWDIYDTLFLLPFITGQQSGFASGIVSLTFDDGWIGQLRAASMLQERGHSATFYLCPALLNQPGYLRIEDLQQLHTMKMHLASHGMSHTILTKLPLTRLSDELQSSKHFLEKHAHQKIEHFASPCGIFDRNTIELAQRLYLSHRSTNEGFNAPGFDPFQIKIKCVTRYTKLRQIQRWLHIAKHSRTWLVLSFHDLTDDYQHDYTIIPNDFSRVLDLLGQSGLQVSNMDSVFRTVFGNRVVASLIHTMI
jgi:peptidoglycan/xylan/chitin deacetylase (PgdA/CDA1 family)